MLGKSEWTLFLIKINKNLVHSFVHFNLQQIHKNKAQFDAGFSERFKLKDDAVPTTLDPKVMLQHTSVSNCFHYVITIALYIITDRLYVVTEYLCVLN